MEDSQSYPPLHWRVSNFVKDDHPLKAHLVQYIEDRFVAVLESGMSINELIDIIEKVEEYMEGSVSELVQEALNVAVEYELTEVADAISHLEGKEELSEHGEYLEKLSTLTGRYATPALEYISEKISEVEDTASAEAHIGFSSRSAQDQEEFDDNALQSLFSNLIDPEFGNYQSTS